MRCGRDSNPTSSSTVSRHKWRGSCPYLTPEYSQSPIFSQLLKIFGERNLLVTKHNFKIQFNFSLIFFYGHNIVENSSLNIINMFKSLLSIQHDFVALLWYRKENFLTRGSFSEPSSNWVLSHLLLAKIIAFLKIATISKDSFRDILINKELHQYAF